MSSKRQARELIVPIYVFFCIILGGSSRAVWGTLALELAALPLIAAAALRPTRNVSGPGRALLGLIMAALVLVAVQLIPLPAILWSSLPGREVIIRGYHLMGDELPWLPISVAPSRTLSSALSLLPPIAIVVAILRLDVCHERWAVLAILVSTVLSILLGYLQVSSNSSNWYFYEVTNLGAAVGFFANRNHMGTLLVMVIPFIAALIAAEPAVQARDALPKWLAGAAGAVIILLGIAMNGSLAAILLSLPVLVASILLFPTVKRFRQLGFVVIAFTLVVVVAFLMNSPVQSKLSGAETSSIQGRQEIWRTTMKATDAALPVGTGFGTFEEIYRTFENPLSVGPQYVNHAHNEYLELLLEGGVLSLAMLVAFLIWWARRVGEVWQRPGALLGRAASIASAVVLCHSIVDYPLRTSAIAVIFAFCVGTLVTGSRPSSLYTANPGDLRPTRHAVVGINGRVEVL